MKYENNTIFRQISCILFTGCDCRCVHRVCSNKMLGKLWRDQRHTLPVKCNYNTMLQKKKILAIIETVIIWNSSFWYWFQRSYFISEKPFTLNVCIKLYLNFLLVMGFGFNGSICAQKKPGEVKITVCVLYNRCLHHTLFEYINNDYWRWSSDIFVATHFQPMWCRGVVINVNGWNTLTKYILYIDFNNTLFGSQIFMKGVDLRRTKVKTNTC